MSNNRYTLPGWLAISLAVLFPLNVVFGIVQSILGKKLLGIEGPMVGPSDLLSVLFTFLRGCGNLIELGGVGRVFGMCRATSPDACLHT